MIRNYLIIAVRHLKRHRLFSTINILCLAVGLTFALLIGVYVINQEKVNAGLRNAGRQYVIRSEWKVKNMGLPITTVAPLASELKAKYPGLVANYYRFNPVTNVVSAGDRHFKENIAICDTSLVSMYGFKMLAGDPRHAFINSNSAVITREMAVKLFGTVNAIGQSLTISGTTSGQQQYAVSAVLETLPFCTVNNYIDEKGYNVFVPFEGSRFFQGGPGENNWSNIYLPGMIELQPGVSIDAVEKAAAQLLSLNLPDNLQGLLKPGFVPMQSYYLRDNDGAVQKMLTTLSLIAGFILLMAIINFVNINIGTSSYRLKEIGLRKVFGGERRQLVAQHIIESVVINIVAGFISVCLYEMLRPMFGQLLNTHLDSIWDFGWDKIGFVLGLVLAIGLLAGIYPAFVLSSSNIVSAAKGRMGTAKGGAWLRKGLLVVQFSLAIFVFIAAINVSRQVSYVFKKDLGYNKEQLLVVTAFPKQWDSVGVMKMQTIKAGLRELAFVQDAAISFEVPDRTPPGTIDLVSEVNGRPVVVPLLETDEDYARTFGMKMKDGFFFEAQSPGLAQSSIVLNETAARQLGIKAAAGSTVNLPSGEKIRVAGIIGDYNYSSFRQAIGPMAFIHIGASHRYRYLTLKLRTSDIGGAIAGIAGAWKKLSPGSPFEYTFMDQRFATLYQSEVQLRKATTVATVLNLFIVFLGIFGVMAFTLARRNREIAVRKVLGAEVRSIIFLFIRDYAWLILAANLVAWPLAYMATDRWLENYAYRIQQNIIPYLFVCVFVFLVAALFIALQCFKVATTNPVKSLKTE